MRVRLIASDMDGSLLNDKKEFPPRFWEDLQALDQKGIPFVAASGRSYPKQRRDFQQAPDSAWFICDNGALVMHQDAVCFSDCLDAEGVHQIIDEMAKIPDILPVLCGVQGAWHTPCPEAFRPHLTSYYINDHIVEDLHTVTDRILKIAICDLRGSANNSYPTLCPSFDARYNLVLSGPLWMDIMNRSVNKGRALRFIQEKLGVSREETMAFGDFYNDVELLQQASMSYVMENANDDMKQYGKFVAPSNNEFGVMQVIHREVLDRF